ncbi:hypothetical protein [Microbacterium aurum]
MNPAPRSLSLLALLGAGVLLFAGCASGTAVAGAGSDASDGSASPAGSELEVEAGWLDGGRQIALVTWGSSTCVPTAADVAVQADGAIAVTLDNGPADRVCTADFAPRATLVGVPDGVDPAAGIDLVVSFAEGGRGETALPSLAGAPGGDAVAYAPSAGWVGGDLIAILSWGSSSCAPVVEDVAAPTPTEVAVTFADQPADQPCTMDMASRVALASVEGLGVERTGSSVVLSGGDAQFETPVTVSILG